MIRTTLLAAAVLCAGTAARADIINLSAGPTNPNAGPASYQTYATPNPVVEMLAAGTYSVSVVGIAGGGTYDAFTISTPAGAGSYSDGWHYAIAPGLANNSVVTGSNYNSASSALAAYKALGPTMFTLASAATVDFYLNDAAFPYFADDTGGVSLSLTQTPAPTAVPEPATLGVLGAGIAALVAARRLRAARS